ncbi:MAG TPA: glycosyltransferase family 9 protein [Caulobacteraceae bacterium]|nr:glycosyltransferase family 9 protein [Caulobacteraceae bacterium]
MSAKPFPILFVTASRIGDAVLASGLVQRLNAEIPEARFTIVGSPLTAPLFAEVPNLDRLIVMDKLPGSGHWFSLWRQVRGKRWGLVVDLRGSAIANVLRPRRRAVHRKGAKPVHKVIEAARLLKLEADPPAPYLYTSAETEARAEALTAGRGPILAMAPAANWIGKTWPAERFALVARRLLSPGGPMQGGRLMVLGGPEDGAACDPVKAAVGRDYCIDLVGRESLLTCYAALKRARLFIGNDSGLMHLAAAAGAPTLGLFGPSDEKLYRPWGLNARTVRGTRSLAEIRAQDPTFSQAITHMMDLSADSVFGAACDLLEDSEDPAVLAAIARTAND